MSLQIQQDLKTNNIHKNMITSFFMPSEKTDSIYSSSRDGTILKWKVTPNGTLTVERKYKRHTHFVSNVLVNKNNTKMISCGWDRRIVIGDVQETNAAESIDIINKKIPFNHGNVVVLGHDKDVTAVCINDEDNMIASCGRDKAINLWNVNGKLQNSFIDSCWVNCCCFIPKTETIITGNEKGELKFWNVMSGKLLKLVVNGQILPENDDNLEENNEEVAQDDDEIKEINDKFHYNIEEIDRSAITCLAVSYDGGFCTYGNKNGDLYIVSINDSKIQNVLNFTSPITALSFSYWEPKLAVATKEQIIIIEFVTFSIVQAIDNEEQINSVCTALAWYRNGVIAGFKNGTIASYDLESKESE